MKNLKRFTFGLAIAAVVLVTGCANSQKAGTYQTGLVQQSMKIKLATVLDVREVQIEAQNSSVGATTGATVGAIAGSTSGKHGAIHLAICICRTCSCKNSRGCECCTAN